MRCIGCGYDLTASPAGPCPECGRPFDPARPDTFRATPDLARERLLSWIVVGLSVPPVLSLALAHLALVAARIELGRWPTRWTSTWDDPTNLKSVELLNVPAGLMCLGTPIYLVASVALLGALAVARSRRLVLTSILFVTIWGGCFLLAYYDPARALSWFMD